MVVDARIHLKLVALSITIQVRCFCDCDMQRGNRHIYHSWTVTCFCHFNHRPMKSNKVLTQHDALVYFTIGTHTKFTRHVRITSNMFKSVMLTTSPAF